jgi:hypothetical protein
MSPRPAEKPIPKPAFLEGYLKTLPKPDLYATRFGSNKKAAPVAAAAYTPDTILQTVLTDLSSADSQLRTAISAYKNIYNPVANKAMEYAEKTIMNRLKALVETPDAPAALMAEIKAEAANMERQSRLSTRTR